MSDIVERLRDAARIKGYGLHGEAADEILRLRSELEQAQQAAFKAMEWQPIETAPKDGTSIVINTNAHDDGIVIARWYRYNGLEAFRDWDADPHTPTHWMPIPLPIR